MRKYIECIFALLHDQIHSEGNYPCRTRDKALKTI